MYRDNEMLIDLFKAIYADDLPKARETLDLMMKVTKFSDRILEAKRAVHPPLRDQMIDPNPMKLPMPGHIIGSTIAKPMIATDAKV